MYHRSKRGTDNTDGCPKFLCSHASIGHLVSCHPLPSLPQLPQETRCLAMVLVASPVQCTERSALCQCFSTKSSGSRCGMGQPQAICPIACDYACGLLRMFNTATLLATRHARQGKTIRRIIHTTLPFLLQLGITKALRLELLPLSHPIII